MTIGRIDVNEKDLSKVCNAVIQLEERADADDTGVVRTDTAQSLTSTQQVQARSNIYAAPFDALAYNGLQINGSMEVSQELGLSSPVSSNGLHICDGWKLYINGTMVTPAFVGIGSIAPGLANNLTVTVTTAQASLGATDYCLVAQSIEGYRTSRLAWGTAAAQPITIGFWTNHHRPGLYSVSIRNGASNRCYVSSYTHSVADAAQYNTITIPGDTTGTWANDNTRGLEILFCLGTGATYTTAAGAGWTASPFFAVTGQVNAVASTSDVFRLSGVVVLPGNEAPSAARSALIMRPYGQELVTCQRYFYSGLPPLRGVTAGGSAASRMGCLHPVTMRATPTTALIAGLPVYSGNAISVITAITTNFSTATTLELECGTNTAVFTAGTPMAVYQASGGILNVDARL